MKDILITEQQLKSLHEHSNFENYKDRWFHERLTLKKYLANYGTVMISRENGKEYKVIQDPFISGQLGINYCICIQWNSMLNLPGEIIYIRASDKFAPKQF